MGNKTKAIEKTYKIRITDNAIINIDDIVEHIAIEKHQPLNAVKVYDAFFEMFEKIETHPWAYAECKEIPTVNHIYRRAICFDWLIIYKIKKTTILILGVIHGSRKPSKIRTIKRVKT